MIKLIVSDMDGTLLTTHTEIAESTAQSIKKAKELGIEFMVATGRNRGESLPALEKAGINCPLIAVNGARVYDEKGNTLALHPISKEETKEILTILEEHDVYVELGTTQGIFSEQQEKRFQWFVNNVRESMPHVDYDKAVQMTRENLKYFPIKYVKSIRKELEREDIEVLKLFCIAVEKDENFEQVIAAIEERDFEVILTSSAHDNLEINHKDAQKGIALKEIAEMKGILPSEIMAIGDSFNDVSMLQYVGESFAMGNAREEVKKIAKHIAPKNTEDGVGWAIEKVIAENL